MKEPCLRIGPVPLRNPVFLAPMAGVADLPFRLLCREQGCGLAYTEMISAKGLLYNNENTKCLLETTDEDTPLGIQLFGADPDILAEAAARLNDHPAAFLDINMGCPVPKIVKNSEGSALMKSPERVGEIVKAVVSASKKPVTVKIRKGFDTCNAVEIGKRIEQNGASAIAIHGRTRDQYYHGQADWDIIKHLKEAVSIPVIGNGDIRTPQDAEQMLMQTGCDAVMIGRSSQGNPWLFRRTVHYLQTGELLPEPSWEEKIRTALQHGRMLASVKGEAAALREMRKHLGWYIKGCHGSAGLRAGINRTENFSAMEELIHGLQHSPQILTMTSTAFSMEETGINS